jgi:hypothetical protein
MFVHMKKLPAKTADVLDLIIEFATLGEYGLEYPDQPARGRAALPESIHRSRASSCERGRPRARANASASARQSSSRKLECRPRCSSEATDFASALRPPRIQLSFTE